MLVSTFYLNNSSGKLFKSSQETQVSPFPLEMEGNLTKNNSITRVSLGILKSVSHFPKKLFYLLQWKTFKNENCFLFHLKSRFCSQDI